VKRVLVFLLTLLFAAILGAGCQSAPDLGAGKLLRNVAPGTCEADLRDQPCVVCLKTRCCALARACTGGCKCAGDCALTNNTQACAAACPTPQARALGACMASSCAGECPGGRP